MTKFTKYVEKRLKIFLSFIGVFGERHRTNNYLEGWNSKLNKYINKNTVSLLRLLNVLKQFVTNSEVQLISYNRGNRRRKAQIVNDNILRYIQMELVNDEIALGHALEKLR